MLPSGVGFMIRVVVSLGSGFLDIALILLATTAIQWIVKQIPILIFSPNRTEFACNE